MKDREKRRDRTLRAQARAYRVRKDQYDRHTVAMGGIRVSRYFVEPKWLHEPHRFAKNGQGACDCRHKRHGRPKVGKGVCQIGRLAEHVHARIAWRKVRETLLLDLRMGMDPLDFED